jgi:hypothetical protein
VHLRRTTVVPAAIVLTAVALVAGCSGDSPAPAASPTTTAAASAGSGASPTTGQPTTGGASPSAAAVGEVVEGFPTDVVPVMPGATVKLSTVATTDGVRQVALAGETTEPADAVLAFYRNGLTAQGFTEANAALPQGAVGATFVRGEGSEILTLSVVSVDGKQQFSIGGQIAA